MKIKLLCNTRIGGPKKSGEVVDVSVEQGVRLIDNGIGAEFVEEKADEKHEPEDKYEGMKAKQLYDLCIEKGLEVDAKQSAEYYKEALTKAE